MISDSEFMGRTRPVIVFGAGLLIGLVIGLAIGAGM
jgi:hypothetical protein